MKPWKDLLDRLPRVEQGVTFLIVMEEWSRRIGKPRLSTGLIPFAPIAPFHNLLNWPP